MIPRVLEPEVMDSAEEASDYDTMDHSEVNRVFVGDFLAAWGGDSPVLDVGTGTAQIPIELCRRHPTARVIAVDLAAAMLEIARANVAAVGFAERIEPRLIDAKSLPFADGEFPAVMSNSIVHHIPEPAGAIAEIIRVTRAGGTIFVRDLVRPPDVPTMAKLVVQYAGQASDRQRKLFADSLRAALTVEEVRALVAAAGQDPTKVTMTSDRHWTWSCRRA